MNEWLKTEIEASISVKAKALADPVFIDTLAKICSIATKRYREGHKLLVAGNGGSAADAQHIAAELVSRFYFDRPALPAIALTTDTSILTAIGNDYGYEQLFARQIEALGKTDDVLLVLSTSGQSKNIIEAIKTGKRKGLTVFGFSGESGGEMASLCDLCLKVPSKSTPRIQEVHILAGHLVCAYIEKELFAKSFGPKTSPQMHPKTFDPSLG